MPKQLLLLELNEVNFEFVEAYAAGGELPRIAELMRRHGVARTTSESRHEELEPWIQWVTAHTGLTFAEHGVYRLGDIVRHDLRQIWEELEAHGLVVGAVSPMNAKLQLKKPAFFVPDPWTPTGIVAPAGVRRLFSAVRQAVNDNAQQRVTVRSTAALLDGFVRYASPANYPTYLRMALRARGRPWYRAMILDLLLADVFVREVRRTQPAFASLFLNAAAHIQHHYMFNAKVYRGPNRNPGWYVAPEHDPVLEVYRLYDRLVDQVLRQFPHARLMIATGLHQDPYPTLKYYWRLREHEAFLRLVGARFAQVESRMSRDFVVKCSTAEEARAAEITLRSATDLQGEPLFDVDNRGTDLFVMLVYPKDIEAGMSYKVGGKTLRDLRSHVSFVALKNGDHNGTGYFIDSGTASGDAHPEFALADLYVRVLDAFDLGPAARARP